MMSRLNENTLQQEQLDFGPSSTRFVTSSSSSRQVSSRTITSTTVSQQSSQTWSESGPKSTSRVITTTTRSLSSNSGDPRATEKRQVSNTLPPSTTKAGGNLYATSASGAKRADAAPAMAQPTSNGNQSHYNENILLRFATEHANNEHYRPTTSLNNYQRSTLGAKGTPVPNERVKRERNAGRSSTLPGKQLTVAAEQPRHQQLYQALPPQMVVGKFVNYYPAERQPSRPSSPQRNYSFHVPLTLPSSSLPQTGSSGAAWQARYGFVAPLDRLKAGPGEPADDVPLPPRRGQPKGWNSSFKSRTISHLPDMVKLSVDDTLPARQSRALELGSQRNYQDSLFGQDQAQAKVSSVGLSEGDLLRAHRVSLARVDPGSDNPFRPGTELSWEADLMVRLMKRGYPLDELSKLVQSAKQVAATDRDRVQLARVSSGSQNPATLGRQLAADDSIRRQTSIVDLNSDTRRAWANSLSRARSMPRGLGLAGELSGLANEQKLLKASEVTDTDSIDRLISNIEDELQQIDLSKDSGNQSMVSSTSPAHLEIDRSQPKVSRSRRVKTAAKTRSKRGAKQVAAGDQDQDLKLANAAKIMEKRKSKPCCKIN